MKKWRLGVKQNYFSNDPESWTYCGVCSLYFVLRSIGIEIEPEEVVNEISMRTGILTLMEQGMTSDDMTRVLSDFGVIGQNLRFPSSDKDLFFKLLLKLATPHRPIMVFPPGHVVSVIGMTGKFVYYIEPDDVTQIVSCATLSEFQQYCFGYRGFAEALPLIYCPSD